ncbi:MAG: hypothetical protein ACTHLJ_01160 [Angustibacter sp.]
MPAANPQDISSVIAVVSRPRFDTYVNACAGDSQRAAALYGWNARVSAALMVPAHLAEIAVRNAVDEVLVRVYGARWPWNPTFIRSLTNPTKGYSPQRDLLSCASQQPSTGKVIAELKFVFWEKMFTARHDVRLWERGLTTVFPHAPTTLAVKALRNRVYADLETIRRLRNRVAHHEPIFTRDIAEDLARMVDLIELRSAEVGQWARAMEDVTSLLAERP